MVSTYHHIQHAEQAIEHIKQHPRLKLTVHPQDIFDYEVEVELMPDASPMDVKGLLDMMDHGNWEPINSDSEDHTWRFMWSKDSVMNK